MSRQQTNVLLISVHSCWRYYWMKGHCAKKPVTTMLTYPWKCTVLHCNHLGNTWKPLVLMTRYFDYCPSAGEGDNQSVRSSAPVVSRCFPGGYNVKLYISRGRLAWWLLFFFVLWDYLRSPWLLRSLEYSISMKLAGSRGHGFKQQLNRTWDALSFWLTWATNDEHMESSSIAT